MLWQPARLHFQLTVVMTSEPNDYLANHLVANTAKSVLQSHYLEKSPKNTVRILSLPSGRTKGIIDLSCWSIEKNYDGH